jgi:hypothetical protein
LTVVAAVNIVDEMCIQRDKERVIPDVWVVMINTHCIVIGCQLAIVLAIKSCVGLVVWNTIKRLAKLELYYKNY